MPNRVPKHGIFCWNELMTKNKEGARQFYSDLIGWKFETSNLTDAEYELLKVGETSAGGMMQITAEMGPIPSHWLAYISVDDVDATTGKVEGLGGKVFVQPMDIPSVGRFSVIADPTGAAVGLITLKQME